MLNNIKSFGLNIIPNNRRTIERTAESVENAISSLWNPILDYLETNDNVFTGEVTNEIEKINSFAMRVTMAMNSGNKRTSINYES